MKYTVYILFSETYNRTYVGYSSDVLTRLSFHNSNKNKGWTRRFQPWTLIYTEEYDSKTEALRREKQLKTGKGRELIKLLVKNKK